MCGRFVANIPADVLKGIFNLIETPQPEPRFTDIHNEGLDGVFGDAGATKIIHLLEDIELRAAA